MNLNKKQKNLLIRIIISSVVFVAAMIVLKAGILEVDEDNYFALNNIILFAIFLVPYVIVGGDIVTSAFKKILNGQLLDEEFLMVIATFGAFAIQEFEETVAVMLFFQIGELLQAIAIGKSRRSIAAMMDIAPSYANLVCGEEIKKVDPDDVQIDDVIVVRSGEKVPLDGIVIEGKSAVDTSALTGESVPRTVEVGDQLLSGCINGQGTLRVRVTKEYDDCTVAKVLELVEDAADAKAKTENFIRRFAYFYTPIVVVFAVLLATVPAIFGWRTVSACIRTACVFLVTSCPCALVISVPLSYFGGIGAAAKRGVLVKGGNFLEVLAKTNTVVFDKTGTLTKGTFTVTEINLAEGVTKEELLTTAAIAEAGSTHPIALSILNYTNGTILAPKADSLEEIPGHGAKASYNGATLLAGNLKLMDMFGIKAEKTSTIGSIVYVAKADKFLGSIVVSDSLKEDTISAIDSLKKNYNLKTAMLSGDKKEVAEAIGKQIGLDEVYAELLPDDKVSKLREMLDKKTSGSIAYVGDGINDAPVLALSDVGIAMGSLGSDAAIEAADVVLMDDKPSKLLDALRIARKTNVIVNENIYGSLAVKFSVLILGALGIASMWMAILADVGVMLLAVINASRTLKLK